MDTVGTFAITYNVDDSSGNSAVELSKTITIVDTIAPVITDSVGATSYVTGTTEPDWTVGVTAVDAVDGNLTSSIVVTSTAVDMTTVGTFNILYNVADTAGNNAVEVVRTITITSE